MITNSNSMSIQGRDSKLLNQKKLKLNAVQVKPLKKRQHNRCVAGKMHMATILNLL